MVRKYIDNYRLDIAYATIFRNIKPIQEIKIHDVLSITSGDNLIKTNMVSGPYIVYGGGGSTNKTHFKFNIDYKTIGIGRVGARCGCVFTIEQNSWVTDNALLIQSFDKRFTLNYLRHFLSFSDLGQYANNSMQPVISKARIKDVLIPLVSTKEQEKISIMLDAIEENKKFENTDYNHLKSKIDIIDNWEFLSEEIETQKDLLTQLKQSILQEAIQGKLTEDWRIKRQTQEIPLEDASELLKRIKTEKEQLIKDKKIKKEKPLAPISEEEIPFELPEGWVWCRLGELNNVFLGGAAFSSTRFIKQSNIQVIRISNVKNDELNLYKAPVFIDDINAKENLRNELFAKDILITMTGTREKRDYCFSVELIDNHFDNKRLFLNQRVGCFRLNKNVDITFATLALKSQSLLEPVFESSSGAANQANISKTALLNIVFPIPPLEEQKEIVNKVEGLMEHCEELEVEIKNSEDNAQMLMQAVLKEAFEGETNHTFS